MCGNLAIAFAILSFLAQGSAKNDRCAIIKNVHGKRNPRIATLLYSPSTLEVQISCTSVETGAFLSLREMPFLSIIHTTFWGSWSEPNHQPLVFWVFLKRTWRPLCWGFLTGSFLLSSLPVFEGIMSKKCSQPNAGLGRQLRGARTVCGAAGGHTAPQNFIFEGRITDAMTFRTRPAAPKSKG